jgi:selenocysteine-specific elongation factor
VDVVLLVVDAQQSVQPQTREHFEICRLLGIRRGVVALTKIDLATGELARSAIEEFVRGSFLEGAPVIPVSATTGQGLPELKAALAEAALNISVKDESKLARLPIDRSFSIRGYGSVVTGTLAAGSVSTDDELELFPSGRRVRVRGIEVHGARVERTYAGERTALNLSGVDSTDMERGMTLAAPGYFRLTPVVDAMLELLSSAPPLKHGAPVHFHAGAADVLAKVTVLDDSGPIQPGTTAAVRLHLRKPQILLPEDRFILRRFSPVSTIGGGMVASITARGRTKKNLSQRTRFLAQASPTERIQYLVEESSNGLSMADAVALNGLEPEAIRKLHPSRHDWLISTAQLAHHQKQVIAMLAGFHSAQPLQQGMAKEALRAAVLPDAPAFLFEDLLGSPEIVVERETVRLRSHRVTLQNEEQAELERLESVFRSAGMAVPSIAEVLAGSRIDAARARTLLQTLLKQAKLIRVNNELAIHAEAAEAIRSLLQSRKGARFSVGDFKEWTGVSRKYAIPLLEWLDRQRVTRREGDTRFVL